MCVCVSRHRLCRKGWASGHTSELTTHLNAHSRLTFGYSASAVGTEALHFLAFRLSNAQPSIPHLRIRSLPLLSWRNSPSLTLG